VIALPPEVEVVCLARCRVPTRHKLAAILGGRAMYGCANGCGAPLREISDAHLKTPAARQAAAAQIRTVADIKDAPKSQVKEPRRMEGKIKKSPLQQAIDAAVSEQFEPIREQIVDLKARMKALEDKVGEAVGLTDKDLDRKLNERFEDELPELVQRAVIQMLATPQVGGGRIRRTDSADGDAAPAGGKPTCPRGKHRGPHGRKCREAGYKG
jgi:hypothetical protein